MDYNLFMVIFCIFTLLVRNAVFSTTYCIFIYYDWKIIAVSSRILPIDVNDN